MGYKALIEPHSGHHKYSTSKVYGGTRLELFYFIVFLSDLHLKTSENRLSASFDFLSWVVLGKNLVLDLY